ncbi:YbhN family protein [Streptomyces sp. NPDC048527]|uniref:lysylphosphatidylglycerol synthase transmembrane domain-containing protein n=1 Tax=Streptomyces sp. NPDC048527 TaxID=3365568 RepID=UPI003713BC2F
MPAETAQTGQPDQADQASARAGLLGRLLTVLRGRTARSLFVLAAVSLCAWTVVDQWTQVASGFSGIGWATSGAALLIVLLAWFAMMQVWRVLLAAFGSRLPLRAAARVFFVGQLGKYLPGSVWSVVAQMEMGQAHQVPRRRSATSAALTMLVSLVAALLITAVALPFLPNRTTGGYSWVFLAVPVVLTCLHPRLLNPLLDRLLALARRPALEQGISGRATAHATAWALVSWILIGLHIWLLTVRLGAPAVHALPLSIGGFAFAWSVGFLAILAPAGAGVREVILVAALSPVLDVGRATAVALVSRLLTVAADLIAAGVAAWYGRRCGRPSTAHDWTRGERRLG